MLKTIKKNIDLTFKLEIYRGGALHLTVDIDERTQFSHTLNAEHKITAVFVSPIRLDLQTEDYIIHNGERYSMNLPPSYRKSAKITFLYTCEFEHIFYKTHNKLFMHLGSADFSYFGDATAHMQLVIDNLNEISPSGWSLGAMASTEPRLITYVNNEQGFSCRNAISLIAETFELEIYYDGQQIGLVERVGVNTNISFEYGRGDGMYALSRLTPDNYLPANKIYVFGGKTNIPFDYRGGTKRLVFADRFVTRPLEPGEPVIEGVRFYDDIFPERTSSFNSVAGDGLLLTDTALDFDINDHLIVGVVASVVFKSGDLMGNEFEIESYDHDTKTIKIIPYVDENGYILPNEIIQPEDGDLYTLTGISLPQTYVDAAEIKLKQRGDDDISQPERLPYDIEIDEKFMRDNGLSLNVGDRVLIKDDDLDIDDTIRMSSIQYPLVNPDKITAEISDKVLYTKVDRVIKDQKRENDIVVRKQTEDHETTRRNMLRFKQLNDLIFDPEGYFDPERIKPFSIEAYLLSVGAQSQNFGLNGVTISTNHLGDENTMVISAGDLVHYTLEIEGLGYVWTLPQSTFSSLDPAKSYYVYARCSRTVLTGEWMISENTVMAEDPLYPGMWNFNLGILFDVKEGRRDFEFTKGMTFIVGDTIKTGRVQNASGTSYLDLDTGQLKLGSEFRGMDWSVTRPGYLTIRGGISVSPSGASDYIPVFRGDWNASTPYFRGDTVKWTDGNIYKWINESVEGISNRPPPNPSDWRMVTEKGAPGADGADGAPGADGISVEMRFRVSGSPTVPPPLTPNNPNPTGWTIAMPTVTPPLDFLWMTQARKYDDGTLVDSWSTPVRFSPVDGEDGEDGARGAFVAPRGIYDPLAEYQGTSELVNAVLYEGDYYISRNDAGDVPGGQSFSGIPPTNTNYWNPVDGQFEMIATGLLLATLAYIENLGARYIQTAPPGEKRIEINERRERKNADGTGTGLWADQNNVALFNSGDAKLAEIDDDSSPGLGVFYLEFPVGPTTDPGFTRFRGDMRERNWSEYNVGSIDSRTGQEGDFTNGFPRFVLDLISELRDGGTRIRYFFRRATQGFNASDPNTDIDLFANTSVGNEVSNLRNANTYGAVGTGNTKIIGTFPFDNSLDDSTTAGFYGADNTIIYTGSGAESFTVPRFLLAVAGTPPTTTVNLNALTYTQIGRQLHFINMGSGTLTVSASGAGTIGLFMEGNWVDRASIPVYNGEFVKMKLISKEAGSPTNLNQWRWVVIERGELSV